MQADDTVQQHQLVGAGAADHAEDLAVTDVEVKVFVDRLSTETVTQVADLNDHLRVVLVHQPISMKDSVARASGRITTGIEWTALAVVRSPTDWALPLALKPSR